ncbi:N-acetylmuramidase domain-containing protein [Halomonas sp. HK25]|uniref:N-acetylmuramidase domain-containing protein n=1 Tax=Halomonas sp. HK25 TaxID=3394321 RepID=UPI0039FD8BDC
MSDWYAEVDFHPRQDPILRRGDSGDNVRELQRRLSHAGFPLTLDGQFGPATERAVRAFQNRAGLVVDGLAGPKTDLMLSQLPAQEESNQPTAAEGEPHRPPAGKSTSDEPSSTERLLGQQDLVWAAGELEVPVAAIMAVNEVESRGSGFFSNGRPAILFERHIMVRRLRHHGIDPTPNIAEAPELVNTSPGGYLGGVQEYGRLKHAKQIHHDSALESASWGLFQIMGFHWQHLEYASARHYVECMQRDEREHLGAFVRFIQKDPVLLSSLRHQQWDRFARRYNGPAYARNRYDVKMAQAFASHTRGLRESGLLA